MLCGECRSRGVFRAVARAMHTPVGYLDTVTAIVLQLDGVPVLKVPFDKVTLRYGTLTRYLTVGYESYLVEVYNRSPRRLSGSPRMLLLVIILVLVKCWSWSLNPAVVSFEHICENKTKDQNAENAKHG